MTTEGMTIKQAPNVLMVGGEDRSRDLGPELRDAAASLQDAGLAERIRKESDLTGLGAASDTEAYLDRHMELLRGRTAVDVSELTIPRTTGPGGRHITRLRTVLWKLLRHQQDWVALRQNAVNAQLAYELEFERDARRRDVAALEARVRALETQVSARQAP